jgi:hypothetical protein
VGSEAVNKFVFSLGNCTVSAPWYIRNSDHRDLGIETVTNIIDTFGNSHEKRLQNNINIEESRLIVNNITRRLKRKKSFETDVRTLIQWMYLRFNY